MTWVVSAIASTGRAAGKDAESPPNRDPKVAHGPGVPARKNQVN